MYCDKQIQETTKTNENECIAINRYRKLQKPTKTNVLE